MAGNRRDYFFSGHSVGASAYFDRIGTTRNLDHVVPTLGGSVLSITGGASKSHVSNFSFSVDQPRRITLLSVRSIDTRIEGKQRDDAFETDIEGVAESAEVVEKLRVGRVMMHFNSARQIDDSKKIVKVRTNGCKIEGLQLGPVQAKVKLDEEPLCAAGTRQDLADFYRSKKSSYRRKNSWRFNTAPESVDLPNHGGYHRCSIVREIKLVGEEKDKAGISVDGYTIIWKGFGRIILGEVWAGDHDRRLTMVRLAMGSDAGGGGVIICGRSNGQVGTG